MDNKETKKDVPLATEIIKTLKKIIFALIITNVLTVGGFLWYISLPVEESVVTEQTAEDIENSDINQIVGGDVVGESEAKSD